MIDKIFSKFFSCFILVFTLFLAFKINVKAQDTQNITTLEKGVLTVGTNATFPPFEYLNKNTNEFDGFDIALVKELAKRLNLKIKIVDMEFSALISAIGSKIDIITAGMTKTEERAKAVDFSDVYFMGKQFILTLKDREIKNEESLKGLKIGTQLGTTASEHVQKLKDVTLKNYDNYIDMVNDILKKGLDVAILDETTAKVYENIFKGKIKAVDGSVLNFPTENSCIACSKQNRPLLDAINKVLFEIKNDAGPEGYNALVEKYIKSNEYMKQQEKENVKNKFDNLKNDILNKENIKQYASGVVVTLKISFFAAIIGFLFGIILALLKISKNKNGGKSILSRIAGLYIDIIRGTPVLVQLFIMYYVILKSCKNGVFVAIVAFGLNSAAYVAEILRGGINSVDVGQKEAGFAMGFNNMQTMKYIVLPQGIKNSIPALCNEFISLIKETAVVGYLALEDLTRVAHKITAATYRPFIPLITVALIYFAITKIVSFILSLIEKRFV